MSTYIADDLRAGGDFASLNPSSASMSTVSFGPGFQLMMWS